MAHIIHSSNFFDSTIFERPGLYSPPEGDDRTKILLHSWIKLHNSYSLMDYPPISMDYPPNTDVSSRIAKMRMSRTQEIISLTYRQIRSTTKDVACILEDGDTDEVYLRALFHISYLLVSVHWSFFSIKAYENVADYVLDIVSNPNGNTVYKENSYISTAEYITKYLDGGSCKEGELQPLFHEIYKTAFDRDESNNRLARYATFRSFLDGSEKNVIYDESPSSSSAPPSLSSKVDFATEHSGKAAGQSSIRFKWILLILKQMISQFKDDGFVPDLEFGNQTQLDVESSDSIHYMVNHVSRMKKDFIQRLYEVAKKIGFCRMIYDGSEVYPKLNIFFYKMHDVIMDLLNNISYGCDGVESLDPEIARGFQMLTMELRRFCWFNDAERSEIMDILACCK